MVKLTGISGGIGSGKSTVCKCLIVLGYKVYDCDSRAKEIMDSSSDIKHRIACEICPSVISEEGAIDRKMLSDVVFKDSSKLSILNNIVHLAVRDDLIRWREENKNDRLLFVESAIMYQSGLDKIVDEIWEVAAPEDLRVKRVCLRNGMSGEQVRNRIKSQMYEPSHRHIREFVIYNDDAHSILAQIHSLLEN